MNHKVYEFLGSLYSLQESEPDEHAQFVFEVLSSWLKDKQFDLVNDALDNVDVTKVSKDTLLSFLTITNCHGFANEHRSGYWKRASDHVRATDGKKEAKELFGNVERPMGFNFWEMLFGRKQ